MSEPVEDAPTDDPRAEARMLLRLWRRGVWTLEDSDAAWGLISQLEDDGADELADRLIYAVERFRCRAAARFDLG